MSTQRAPLKPINVGLLGIGTVGGGTFEVLRRNQEEIARRAERERAFSANVAHQLRSPLTALDMRLEELAACADPDVRQQKASFLFDDTLIDVCDGEACTADARE